MMSFKLNSVVLIFAFLIAHHSYGQVVTPSKIFKDDSIGITNPFDLRDPFKRNLPKRSRLKRTGDNRYLKDGVFSNFETVDGVPLERIRVVGVLLGPNRRALVKIINESRVTNEETGNKDNSMSGTESKETSKVITVKEGMTLGLDGAEVKAILPGGIVLVEKIKNVYDQDEYLETIIPISE